MRPLNYRGVEDWQPQSIHLLKLILILPLIRPKAYFVRGLLLGTHRVR